MRCPPELGVINLENTQGDQTGPKEQARRPRFSIGATHLTRNKLSDRGRERASLRTARCNHTKATHQSGPRVAAAVIIYLTHLCLVLCFAAVTGAGVYSLTGLFRLNDRPALA